MPPLQSAAVDQTLAVFGCAAAPALLANRWRQYTLLANRWRQYTLLQRCYFALGLATYLCILLLPRLRPRAYKAARAPAILLLRLLSLVGPGRYTAVRLAQPPTGRLVRDLFLALTGLRLLASTWAGLLGMPSWHLWGLQQLAVVLAFANIEQDCQSQLLSHPLTLSRIARFHDWMRALLAPILPQARLIVPTTQLGQCKAAVTFATGALCLLLPALLLVPLAPEPPRPLLERGASLGDWSRWLDWHAECVLRTLRCCGGLLRTLGTWWLVLVALWAVTAAAF